MISIAKAKFIRVSARKVRDVINLVRGKTVSRSLDILNNVNKRARKPIIKVLESAISNAKQFAVTEKNLYISKIVADEGPMLKRFKSAPFGRAVVIRHRLCHITVELDERKRTSALPSKIKKEEIEKTKIKPVKSGQRKVKVKE